MCACSKRHKSQLLASTVHAGLSQREQQVEHGNCTAFTVGLDGAGESQADVYDYRRPDMCLTSIFLGSSSSEAMNVRTPFLHCRPALTRDNLTRQQE